MPANFSRLVALAGKFGKIFVHDDQNDQTVVLLTLEQFENLSSAGNLTPQSPNLEMLSEIDREIAYYKDRKKDSIDDYDFEDDNLGWSRAGEIIQQKKVSDDFVVENINPADIKDEVGVLEKTEEQKKDNAVFDSGLSANFEEPVFLEEPVIWIHTGGLD